MFQLLQICHATTPPKRENKARVLPKVSLIMDDQNHSAKGPILWWYFEHHSSRISSGGNSDCKNNCTRHSTSLLATHEVTQYLSPTLHITHASH